MAIHQLMTVDLAEAKGISLRSSHTETVAPGSRQPLQERRSLPAAAKPIEIWRCSSATDHGISKPR
jgi:hypothetical protein